MSLGSIGQDLTIEQCDISTGLIIGGIQANRKEFPHMAAVGFPSLNGDIDFGCSASLISERFLLTAAHCSRKGQDKLNFFS